MQKEYLQNTKYSITYKKGQHMQKLELIQIMNLADKLNHTEWITILMRLNNNGQLEEFFETIQQQYMLKSVLQSKKKSHTR
jgi:hypothetical protein